MTYQYAAQNNGNTYYLCPDCGQTYPENYDRCFDCGAELKKIGNKRIHEHTYSDDYNGNNIDMILEDKRSGNYRKLKK